MEIQENDVLYSKRIEFQGNKVVKEKNPDLFESGSKRWFVNFFVINLKYGVGLFMFHSNKGVREFLSWHEDKNEAIELCYNLALQEENKYS